MEKSTPRQLARLNLCSLSLSRLLLLSLNPKKRHRPCATLAKVFPLYTKAHNVCVMLNETNRNEIMMASSSLSLAKVIEGRPNFHFLLFTTHIAQHSTAQCTRLKLDSLNMQMTLFFRGEVEIFQKFFIDDKFKNKKQDTMKNSKVFAIKNYFHKYFYFIFLTRISHFASEMRRFHEKRGCKISTYNYQVKLIKMTLEK